MDPASNDTPVLAQRLGSLENPRAHGWLARTLGDPTMPESVVFIDADGRRRVHEAGTPAWALPATFGGLGLAMAIFAAHDTAGRIAWLVLGAVMAALYHRVAAVGLRHLVLDGVRRRLVILQGRTVALELPFEAIDLVYADVKANPGYSDIHRAVARIGGTELRLTGVVTTADDAQRTARAVAELTGAPLEPGCRRRGGTDDAT